MKRLLLLLLVLFTTLCVNAQLKLPGIIRDSMIMQRDVPVKIWGWAAPNEKVKIVFKKKSYSVKADAKRKLGSCIKSHTCRWLAYH
ncbi:MAG: hypothetical protein NVV59_14220 [Chitinophagaceae bacterium]|nr:hypothetical protein [Chitinophagaceae bacterium]